jgi:hypothetical protein
LVCYGFYFQFFEHDGEIFEELKGIGLIEKPLQDEEITGSSTRSCDEKYGGQDDDDVRTLFSIEGNILYVDIWFIYGDPIYNMDGESLSKEDMN